MRHRNRLVLVDAWLFKLLLSSVAMLRCAFFPFPRVSFVSATSLVLQKRWSHFLHAYLNTQPSSRTFWLMAYSVSYVNSVQKCKPYAPQEHWYVKLLMASTTWPVELPPNHINSSALLTSRASYNHYVIHSRKINLRCWDSMVYRHVKHVRHIFRQSHAGWT
jgi:hypothetical protein